jgi:predicted DNA-binding transcriptional regulator YafY
VHRGRWYLVAHDHDRADLRTFRADRCDGIAVAEGRLQPPPEGFDGAAVVSRSFARIPRRWQVDVVLALPLEQAAVRVSPSLAELAPADSGTRVRMHVDSLDWTAALLAGLDCDFVVERPNELRDALERLAGRLAARVAHS